MDIYWLIKKTVMRKAAIVEITKHALFMGTVLLIALYTKEISTPQIKRMKTTIWKINLKVEKDTITILSKTKKRNH